MHVQQLSVTNFRNYDAADISLDQGITIFLGPNGQGKTNIVEAVHFLSSLSSHRIAQDQALIKKGAEQAIIRANVVSESRSLLLDVELNRSSRNRAQVNQNSARIRDFPRYFSSVLFAPEDLQLVRGEPELRRNFADDIVVGFAPRMAGVYADYDRVIKQRNTLLKSLKNVPGRNRETSTLELWDEKLVSLAVEITQMRVQLVERLSPRLSDNYRQIAGVDQHPTLALKLSVEDEDTDQARPFDAQAYGRELAGRITENRVKEIERGASMFGPHRDDVVFSLNDLPTKGYASHGETWSFVLSLKLASAELLKDESPLGDPVLILDDVFAELDASRRERLAARIAGFEQCLITCAVADDLPAELSGTVFDVSRGTVTRA